MRFKLTVTAPVVVWLGDVEGNRGGNLRIVLVSDEEDPSCSLLHFEQRGLDALGERRWLDIDDHARQRLMLAAAVLTMHQQREAQQVRP